MPWYALYDKVSGRLHSLGTVLAEKIPDTLVVKALPEWGEAEFPPDGIMWDEGTKQFVPRPAKVLVDRLQDIVSHPDYADFKEVWDALNAARRDKIRSGLIRLLGNARWRNASESITVQES